MSLIEAIPNLSNGKDLALLRLLAQEAMKDNNASLLHMDPNPDANRTVFTLAGTPQDIVKACFNLIMTASQHIDMRIQRGTHPRLGAVDVCPLVPLQGISLAETALFADKLARRVAEELQIPVYLYEENASAPQRRDLSFIRRGEYESLPEKLKILPPDYGPKTWNPRIAQTGATIVGARNFLIAFNLSLNTHEVALAKQIAAKLRAKNGGLPAVKAIGWYMENYKCAQVSCNVTDYHQTNLAVLFEACKKEASLLGLTVTGCEIIGLVPQEALVQAGQFYLPHEHNTALLLRSAIKNLLLNHARPFDEHTQILEYTLP